MLEDYRDFLVVRGFEEWPKTHPYARRLSDLCRSPAAREYDTFRRGIEHDDPAISANILAGLTKVALRLLEGQICRLERDFTAHGGLREAMTRARLEFRDNLRVIEQGRQGARPSLRRVPD